MSGRAYSDPTFDRVASNEERPCGACLWRQWDPFTRVAWCDHDFWVGNEVGRPKTGGVNPMRSCERFDERPMNPIHRRKE